jgi:hypothetical protein
MSGIAVRHALPSGSPGRCRHVNVAIYELSAKRSVEHIAAGASTPARAVGTNRK